VPRVKNNSSNATELASCFAQAEDKYANIDGQYLFEPIAVDTLGIIIINTVQKLSPFHLSTR